MPVTEFAKGNGFSKGTSGKPRQPKVSRASTGSGSSGSSGRNDSGSSFPTSSGASSDPSTRPKASGKPENLNQKAATPSIPPKIGPLTKKEHESSQSPFVPKFPLTGASSRDKLPPLPVTPVKSESNDSSQVSLTAPRVDTGTPSIAQSAVLTELPVAKAPSPPQRPKAKEVKPRDLLPDGTYTAESLENGPLSAAAKLKTKVNQTELDFNHDVNSLGILEEGILNAQNSFGKQFGTATTESVESAINEADKAMDAYTEKSVEYTKLLNEPSSTERDKRLAKLESELDTQRKALVGVSKQEKFGESLNEVQKELRAVEEQLKDLTNKNNPKLTSKKKELQVEAAQMVNDGPQIWVKREELKTTTEELEIAEEKIRGFTFSASVPIGLETLHQRQQELETELKAYDEARATIEDIVPDLEAAYTELDGQDVNLDTIQNLEKQLYDAQRTQVQIAYGADAASSLDEMNTIINNIRNSRTQLNGLLSGTDSSHPLSRQAATLLAEQESKLAELNTRRLTELRKQDQAILEPGLLHLTQEEADNLLGTNETIKDSIAMIATTATAVAVTTATMGVGLPAMVAAVGMGTGAGAGVYTGIQSVNEMTGDGLTADELGNFVVEGTLTALPSALSAGSMFAYGRVVQNNVIGVGNQLTTLQKGGQSLSLITNSADEVVSTLSTSQAAQLSNAQGFGTNILAPGVGGFTGGVSSEFKRQVNNGEDISVGDALTAGVLNASGEILFDRFISGGIGELRHGYNALRTSAQSPAFTGTTIAGSLADDTALALSTNPATSLITQGADMPSALTPVSLWTGHVAASMPFALGQHPAHQKVQAEVTAGEQEQSNGGPIRWLSGTSGIGVVTDPIALARSTEHPGTYGPYDHSGVGGAPYVANPNVFASATTDNQPIADYVLSPPPGRKGMVVIGSSPQVGYTIGNNQKLSRRHARVFNNRRGQLAIRDNDSTNGTLVNGEKIPPDRLRILEENDEVILGGTNGEKFIVQKNPQTETLELVAVKYLPSVSQQHGTKNIRNKREMQDRALVTRVPLGDAPLTVESAQTALEQGVVTIAEDIGVSPKAGAVVSAAIAVPNESTIVGTWVGDAPIYVAKFNKETGEVSLERISTPHQDPDNPRAVTRMVGGKYNNHTPDTNTYDYSETATTHEHAILMTSDGTDVVSLEEIEALLQTAYTNNRDFTGVDAQIIALAEAADADDDLTVLFGGLIPEESGYITLKVLADGNREHGETVAQQIIDTFPGLVEGAFR